MVKESKGTWERLLPQIDCRYRVEYIICGARCYVTMLDCCRYVFDVHIYTDTVMFCVYVVLAEQVEIEEAYCCTVQAWDIWRGIDRWRAVFVRG